MTDTSATLGEGDALPELYRSGRRKRARARASRSVAYVAGLAVVLYLGVTVNWARLGEKYLNGKYFSTDEPLGLFPDVITTAAKNTLIYTVFAFVGGVTFGLVAALLRLSSIRAYRWLAAVYIEIFRGLPALLTIFFIGLLTPIALQFQYPEILGVPTGGIAALSLVAGAYLAETIRAGIEAVPKGQVEASRSLGMTNAQTLRVVVVPQAFRVVIPPLTNELVLLLKDTALLSVLGVTIASKELTQFGKDAANQTYNATPLIASGLVYLAITIPLTRLVAVLERRNRASR